MRFAAAASELIAEEAATLALSEGGTAADALVCGFLAASAARASVLLSPVQALLAGPGVGARAFDGRSRQPGRGLPRPRGFTKGQTIPPAARVAVPASLGMLALVHAHDGNLSLAKLAAPALEHARSSGYTERRAVLARVSRLGAAALRDPTLARPMLTAGGRAEGGLLSEEDLAEVRPDTRDPEAIELGERHAWLLPWPAPPRAAPRTSEVIAAADARGVLGVLSYSPDDEGIELGEIGLMLPCDAVVVERGVPRTKPGEPIPSAAPILLAILAERPFLALGMRAGGALSIRELSSAWASATTAGELASGACRAARGERAIGVLRSENKQAQKVLSKAES